MPIYLGTTEITQPIVGSNSLEYVYSGTDEVWSGKTPIYYIGTGKTFNVATFCTNNGIDYKSLTIDDFFFTPYTDSVYITGGTASYTSCTSGVNCWCGSSTAQGYGAEGHGSCSVGTSRSYTASSGALTLYYGVNSNVYLCPNSSSLISGGTITTVSNGGVVTSDTKGYSSATTTNFLYRTITSKTDSVGCCSSSCPYYISWAKSYTASSGKYTGGPVGFRTGTTGVSAYYFSPTKFKFV